MSALRSAIDRLSAWNVGDTDVVGADYHESHQCQTDLALVLAAAKLEGAEDGGRCRRRTGNE